MRELYLPFVFPAFFLLLSYFETVLIPFRLTITFKWEEFLKLAFAGVLEEASIGFQASTRSLTTQDGTCEGHIFAFHSPNHKSLVSLMLLSIKNLCSRLLCLLHTEPSYITYPCLFLSFLVIDKVREGTGPEGGWVLPRRVLASMLGIFLSDLLRPCVQLTPRRCGGTIFISWTFLLHF